MKSILTILIFLSLVVSGVAQTRNVVAGTNGAVVSPTNFWSADVTNAFSGLGLGTAATNAASAFQPSSLVLSNLSSSNGGGLTNLTASNITGIISISNGGISATTAGGARTNLGLGATWLTNTVASNFLAAIGAQSTNGNGFGLTNLNASNITGQISVSNISTVNFSNISGAIVVASGGTGATNAATARTNLGLGLPALTNTNVSNFKTDIGLGWSALTNSNAATSLLGFITNGQVVASTTNPLTFTNGLAFSTNAALITKSNLGIANILRNGADDGANSGGTGGSINLAGANANETEGPGGNAGNINLAGGVPYSGNGANGGSINLSGGYDTGNGGSINLSSAFNGAGGSIVSVGTNNASGGSLTMSAGASGNGGSINTDNDGGSINTRGTGSIELGITGTRTTLVGTATAPRSISLPNASGTLVSVSTNGTVVSPTNFWQVAPISTTVQYQTNVTATSTNAATNSRNLFLFSLAPTVSGITNTVTLPTNTATTFEGDRATIINWATNSANTVTAIRQLGAATNIITLNQVNEAVLFMYRSGAWNLADNVSYVEPIYFSGTNAAGHAAESRTNLGIPLAALTNTNAAGFQRAIFSTNSVPTNSANTNGVNFNSAIAWMEVSMITNGVTNSYRIPLFQ